MDYEASPERTNMEINVVHFSEDHYAVSDENAAQLDFRPHEAVFQSPKESDNYLKALYMGVISRESQFPLCLLMEGQL